MTGNAVVLLLVTAATLTAALNVQGGWLLSVGSAFAGILLGAVVLGSWGISSIGVRLLSSGGVCQEGESLSLRFELTNVGMLPRRGLLLLVAPLELSRLPWYLAFRTVPPKWPLHFIDVLQPQGTTIISVALPAGTRGIYQCVMAWLQVSPLGLVVWRRRVEQGGKVVVTPRLVPVVDLDRLETGERSAGERDLAPPSGGGQSVRSIREYRPGDPLRSVHWRSTARTGRLVVKQTEDDRTAGSITVAVDLSGHQHPDDLEHTMRVAATVLTHFCQLGYAVSLLTQQGATWGELESLLEGLAAVCAASDPLELTGSGLSRGLTVVISCREVGWSPDGIWHISTGCSRPPGTRVLHCPPESPQNLVAQGAPLLPGEALGSGRCH